MPKALELTWVASLKQWRKRRTVDGKSKTFYLGKGNGKDDRLSYGRALAKWREIEKGIDLAERGSELQRQYNAWRDELASRPDIDPTMYFAPVNQTDLTKPPHPCWDRWANGTARMGEDRFNTPRPSSKPTKTLGQCIDAYIEDQRGRYEHGLRFPSAPQRERISALRFMSYRYNATLLKTDWQDEPVPEDEASLAALMKRFRESQKALMSEGKIEPGTVNERTKTMRHVVRWLHDQYLIPALPRQMVHLCAAYGVKTTAKALDLETLQRCATRARAPYPRRLLAVAWPLPRAR